MGKKKEAKSDPIEHETPEPLETAEVVTETLLFGIFKEVQAIRDVLKDMRDILAGRLS